MPTPVEVVEGGVTPVAVPVLVLVLVLVLVPVLVLVLGASGGGSKARAVTIASAATTSSHVVARTSFSTAPDARPTNAPPARTMRTTSFFPFGSKLTCEV